MRVSHKLFYLFLFFLTSIRAVEVHDLICENNLAIGEKRLFEVMVYNEKDVAEEISLELADFEPDGKGGGNYNGVGVLPRSNAKWIKLSSDRIVLAPHERRKITYHVHVPKDSSLNGSYWSTLLIQAIRNFKLEEEEKEAKTNEVAMKISTQVRYAYNIVTSIGKFEARVKILDKGITTIEGQKYFYADIANKGNFFIRPQLKLKLFGSQGSLVETLCGLPISFYPGYSNRYLVPVNDIKQDKYKAFLVLDKGDAEPFGDIFELKL